MLNLYRKKMEIGQQRSDKKAAVLLIPHKCWLFCCICGMMHVHVHVLGHVACMYKNKNSLLILTVWLASGLFDRDPWYSSVFLRISVWNELQWILVIAITWTNATVYVSAASNEYGGQKSNMTKKATILIWDMSFDGFSGFTRSS